MRKEGMASAHRHLRPSSWSLLLLEERLHQQVLDGVITRDQLKDKLREQFKRLLSKLSAEKLFAMRLLKTEGKQ